MLCGVKSWGKLAKLFYPLALMAHLEQRRNLWYAILTVPEDIREKLGRLRFRRSTGTGDKTKAQIIANQYVAGWKLLIEQARGNLPTHLTKAIEWRKELEENLGKDYHPDMIMRVTEEAEYLAEKHGEAKGQEFFDVVTGRKTPSNTRFDQWKGQLTLQPKTIDQMVRDVELLLERFNTLEEISKKAALEWMDALKEGGATLSSRKRIASNCRNYWRYLQHWGDVDKEKNPLSELQLAPKGKAARKKEANTPYSDEDVKKLFNGASSQVRRGKTYTDQELADFILIAAYTGLRLEEVCSIRTQDVTDEYIRIPDSKTDAGVRIVPIHSRLVPRVKQMVDASIDGYLLSGLSSDNKYEVRGNGISKRFSRLKLSLGFELRKHTAHSFRSTLVTKLENAGVQENVAMDIVGHEKPTMTYGHYSGGASLTVMKEAIERISYPI